MVRDAFRFLIPLAILTVLCLAAGWLWASAALLAATLFVAWFFRDPLREIPPDSDAVVSPADGKVVQLKAVEGGVLLSIFLSIFNVHVNRSPMKGRIAEQAYHPGRFLLAFDERASTQNERLVFTIDDGERRLKFALIAGLVARRIVPWTRQGEAVAKGDKIGLIRFGSRVDVLLPQGCEPIVAKGDRVSGGASVIARWNKAAR